jgi:hypothetical protein
MGKLLFMIFHCDLVYLVRLFSSLCSHVYFTFVHTIYQPHFQLNPLPTTFHHPSLPFQYRYSDRDEFLFSLWRSMYYYLFLSSCGTLRLSTFSHFRASGQAHYYVLLVAMFIGLPVVCREPLLLRLIPRFLLPSAQANYN